MKYLITTIIAIITMVTISAQDVDKLAIKVAVEHQFASYPESTLQDVYKAFYQEHFGPEHMITDTVAVRNYFNRELSTMGDERSRVYFESIGLEGNYVRVYLDAVADGLITADQLLQVFVESANEHRSPVTDWASKWETIVEVIDEIKPGFGAEMRELLHQASLNNQAVHHSRAYNAAYHPHYRIVERSIFELLLMPDISLY